MEHIPDQLKSLGIAIQNDADVIDAFDWLLALLLFLLSLPVLLVGLLWVFLSDFKNPIFTQMRVGKGGHSFLLYKIRSMHVQSEDEAKFCAHGDDRIIPGGNFLRKTRMDELPQFINVLRGQMAVIGPRPEQPAFVKTFLKSIPGYGERFRVKPGITGLAQVHQGYVDSERGTKIKLKYDLFYIQKRSLGFWLKIVQKTVKVVIFGHGAR